jgi:DNA-binding NtrC family response regulator
LKNHDPDRPASPIFIFADDDQEALLKILDTLHDEWSYVPVHKPAVVLKYAKEFSTTAVFLADQVRFKPGGASGLLRRLINEVGKPVVILSEAWSQEEAARWKHLGAHECIPHPTRTDIRMEILRRKLQELATKNGS